MLAEEGERLVNRGFLIDDEGEIRARYDKMHLFDVDLPTGESWRESASFAAGERAGGGRTARSGSLGLSICYDLRFAGLYARLSDAGATVLSIPAAFTVPTGEAHWHVLLRARAIEAGAFVVAAAQGGRHEDGRATYGHSLVVDPWGTRAARHGRRRARRSASPISTWTRSTRCARRLPALRHRRPIPEPVRAMIIFDLQCAPAGHVFEAWFGSTDDYEEQQARGLVSCPICGDGEVDKAPMAPGRAEERRQRRSRHGCRRSGSR